VSLLPLFPLPNVVLFPGILLPLHVFEPRYRELVRDVLQTDQRLGMVLLRSGWGLTYEGNPPIYDVACTGVIVKTVPFDNGYDVVLRGLERVRIVDEDYERSYRRAHVEPMPDLPTDQKDRQAIGELRMRVDAQLDTHELAESTDEHFIHTAAQELDLAPIEQQALLECASLRMRAQALAELLEMKRVESKLPRAVDWHH
jgi:Lon protease-like protein